MRDAAQEHDRPCSVAIGPAALERARGGGTGGKAAGCQPARGQRAPGRARCHQQQSQTCGPLAEGTLSMLARRLVRYAP